MTDLEKEAQRAFDNKDLWYKVNVKESVFKDGYIAGAKAHQTQWHDLRKDPNDLPDNIRCVWTNNGAGYHDEDGWWCVYGRLHDVVAWCEPEFEEFEDVENN